MDIISDNYKRYMMRCECYGDIDAALKCLWMQDATLVKSTQLSLDLGGGVSIPLPDNVIVISCTGRIEYLRALLMNSGKDLHVMAQTIEEEGAYTGERKRV
jgi:hypothetical protein